MAEAQRGKEASLRGGSTAAARTRIKHWQMLVAVASRRLAAYLVPRGVVTEGASGRLLSAQGGYILQLLEDPPPSGLLSYIELSPKTVIATGRSGPGVL